MSAPAREVPIVTASGTIRAATAVADTLAAFGLRRTQFTVVIVDLPRVGEVTGLLGLDFFADRKLCFDFAAGDLELS